MADTNSTIPSFAGTEGPERAAAWLAELISSKTTHQWTDQIAISVATSHLTGGEQKWYMFNQPGVTNFAEFKSKF